MSGYLANMPNDVENFRRLGFDDDDFVDGGSDRFIDAMVVWGSAETVAERLHKSILTQVPTRWRSMC